MIQILALISLWIVLAGGALPASAASNALCVTNADSGHGHRFLWMHGDYDYEIHSALAEAGERVCFESEFLVGPGWYVKAVVKLYEDRYQTAGQEYAAEPVDMGPAEAAVRREYCFRFDDVAFAYAFSEGPCPESPGS
ncbi:MAG: hypothetical protein HOH66_18015 [Rhodospirillaceae bacterium]|jgi:hypothetical protein|nr:hypothetical protein [Rhodospirillaceae bacterium]MBT5414192.1 hypothetical protein [Rhodospirillaceae bacterium]MBT6119763.1 hypothetical protein [Rhodospirillaceae bacterium]